AETDEGNNTKTQVTSVTNGGGCTVCTDLVAAQLLATDPYTGGTPMTIKFHVVNVGDSPTAVHPATDRLLALCAESDGSVSGAAIAASVPGITCTVDAPALPGNFVDTSCKGNLGPGEGVTVTLTLTATGTQFFVIGLADPDNLVPEFNEGNNSA